jgi:putative ABC transport system permease protein
MATLREWANRLWQSLRPSRRDAGLEQELRLHLELAAEDERRRTNSTGDARRAAVIRFGAVAQTMEALRDQRGLPWFDDLVADLRYAARALLRTPGFTLVAVVVLALGVGATTALFSVINAVLLRPLPYPDSDKLVRVWSAMPTNGVPRSGSALPDFRAWRGENHSFEEMGAYHGMVYNLAGVDPPERLQGTRVTASLWTVLKVQPARGVLFSADAQEWGRHRVVVLSNGLWERRFGGDPAMVGRTILLNGQPFTVAAIMPRWFQFPRPGNEVWTPMAYAPGDVMDTRNNRFVDILGRLKPGVTVNQAQSDLAVLAARLRQQEPMNANVDVASTGWKETIVGDARSTLMLLLGAVAFVLLIACTNVANLVLARALSRQQELSVRVALGAGRGRLMRQLLTENLLLASIGAAAGLGLADAVIRALPTVGPVGLPRLHEVRLDGLVVSVAAGLAVMSGVAFGIWPARYAGGVRVAGHLKESTSTSTGGRSRVRARSLLVIAEVSLSLVLLIGAGLLIVSLERLSRIDPGFQPDHLLTANINLPAARYGTPERIGAFIRQTLEGVSAVPGVQAAAITTALPLGGGDWGKFVTIDGQPAPPSLPQVPMIQHRQITTDYFRAIGATLRRGRALTDRDRPPQAGVAVINETMARRFWPDEDPLGKRISLFPPQSLVAAALPKDFPGFPWLTVVGIVEDLRQDGLDQQVNPEAFIPLARAGEEAIAFGSFYLVVRTTADPLSYQRSIESAVHQLDRNLPVADVQTMESRLSDSLGQRRFAMRLFAALAAVALVLVIAGLYGVMAYTVSQRRSELGIRAALGATAGDLMRLVLSQGLRVTAIGVCLGVFGAATLSRFLSRQLFQVQATDPVIYLATSLLVMVVAALACGIPSIQAARVDPVTTLHNQ